MGMAAFALIQPAQGAQADAFKWTLLISWALLGLCLYVLRNRRPLLVGGVSQGKEVGP